MTTIETIAKHAGVSRGTVDRVLHNRGRVKAETMERVQAAMEELHYQPSALGRAFYMSRQNNKIGVLVALREPDFQRQVMEGVEDGLAYAQQHGMEVLVEYASPEDTAAYVAALDRLLEQDLRGLSLRAIQAEEVDARLRDLLEKKVRLVTYNEDLASGLRDCYVGENARQGGTCAAFLTRQIAPPKACTLILGVARNHHDSNERIQGFTNYFRQQPDCGMELLPVVYGRGNHDMAYQVVKESLASYPRITGIFVAGAGLSGAAHAVEDAGLSGKVRIVGYDATDTNISYMKSGTVQFLIDQAPHSQGYRSIQLLAEAIFHNHPIKTGYYDTGIQIRTPYNC